MLLLYRFSTPVVTHKCYTGSMFSRQKGFSATTLVIAVTLILIVALVSVNEYGLWQHRQSDARNKTSVNALDAYLQNIYYPKFKSYPTAIDETMLKSIPEAQRKDALGKSITSQASIVRYEPQGCSVIGTCSGYKLRALLSNEVDYIRSSSKN
jgi:hypothetical protein